MLITMRDANETTGESVVYGFGESGMEAALKLKSGETHALGMGEDPSGVRAAE